MRLPQLSSSTFTLSLDLSRTGIPPRDPTTILFQPAAQGHAVRLEAMPDGGLRYAVRFQRPGNLPENQFKGVEVQRAHFTKLPYWRHPGDPKTGTLHVCLPGYMILPETKFTLDLVYNGVSLKLLLDDVVIDEDWPYGEIPAPTAAMEWREGAGFHLVEAKVGKQAKRPDPSEEQRTKVLGQEEPFGQYWSPRGHNTSAGDVMICFDGSKLHVVHLNDRRNHGSRWGCGACSFEHLSTPDLAHWDSHPTIFPLERQEDTAVGTGCLFYHDKKFYAYGIYLTHRLGAPASDVVPPGVYRSVSDDGIHFVKEPGLAFDPCEPSVWFEESTGIFHLVRCGARMESTDLTNWKMVDPDFLPPPAAIGDPSDLPTAECYTVFKWNDWFYILGGRTGFWMSRDIRGPFWPGPTGHAAITTPRWDLYDGLMVPQCAVVWDNRCIMCGWVVDHWWGGSLVFRELIQYEDGTLGLKWVPELLPAHETPVALESADSISGNTLTSTDAPAWKAFHLPPGDFYLRVRLKASPGTRSFGLNLRASPGYEGGAELRFEPGQRRAQWGRAGHGQLADPAKNPRCYAEDYILPNLEDLDGEVLVEIFVKDTILDACINGHRTMIARRHSLEGNHLYLFVNHGSLEHSTPEAAPLR